MATFLSLKTDPQSNYSEPESVISGGLWLASVLIYPALFLPTSILGRKNGHCAPGAPEPHWGQGGAPRAQGPVWQSGPRGWGRGSHRLGRVICNQLQVITHCFPWIGRGSPEGIMRCSWWKIAADCQQREALHSPPVLWASPLPCKGQEQIWRMLMLRPFKVPLTSGSPVKC